MHGMQERPGKKSTHPDWLHFSRQLPKWPLCCAVLRRRGVVSHFVAGCVDEIRNVFLWLQGEADYFSSSKRGKKPIHCPQPHSPNKRLSDAAVFVYPWFYSWVLQIYTIGQLAAAQLDNVVGQASHNASYPRVSQLPSISAFGRAKEHAFLNQSTDKTQRRMRFLLLFRHKRRRAYRVHHHLASKYEPSPHNSAHPARAVAP